MLVKRSVIPRQSTTLPAEVKTTYLLFTWIAEVETIKTPDYGWMTKGQSPWLRACAVA